MAAERTDTTGHLVAQLYQILVHADTEGSCRLGSFMHLRNAQQAEHTIGPNVLLYLVTIALEPILGSIPVELLYKLLM